MPVAQVLLVVRVVQVLLVVCFGPVLQLVPVAQRRVVVVVELGFELELAPGSVVLVPARAGLGLAVPELVVPVSVLQRLWVLVELHLYVHLSLSLLVVGVA